MNILTLNKISPLGLNNFGSEYNISDDCANPDGIILRSFKMHDMELPESLLAIGRAGAGVNNIPLDKCSEKGIVVFNSPGANANAVKELVLTAMLLSARKVNEGISWVNANTDDENISATVEKEKSNFVGPEILGKTLGVVGLGAIGILVANVATSLGMKVVGYDPYLSVSNAVKLKTNVELKNNLEDIFAVSDFVTIHVPLNADTKNSIDKKLFDVAKDGLKLINMARGGIVNEVDLKVALKDGKVAKYVTDFPNPETVGVENIINIPHLGASTPESEENCAIMAVNEVKEYLETGNILNSVNYPNTALDFNSDYRLCILHKNVPNVLGTLTSILGSNGINVKELINKSKNDVAYTILNIETDCTDDIKNKIEELDDVFRLRVLKK